MTSWVNYLCVVLVVAGFLLFLVGANIYDALTGWSGVYMFIGGIMLYLIFYVYGEIKKGKATQKP